MAATFAPGMPAAKELQSAIHSQLVEFGYVEANDPALAEYISVMIANERTADDVANELRELLGDGYNHQFVVWLFQWVDSYLKNAAAPTLAATADGQQQQQQQMQQQPSPVVDQSDGEAKRERRPARTSRLLHSALSDATRDAQRPSRSGRHDRHRDVAGRAASESPHRRSRATSSPSRGADRRSRLSSDHRSRSPGQTRSVKFTVNLGPRTNANTFKSTPKKGKASPGEEQQQREAIRSQALEDASMGTTTSRKARCSYWPQCAKGAACTFHHPTTLCSRFPNCPKPADQCFYIHPATDTATPATTGATGTSTIPCKYGSYCTNQACPFVHPGSTNTCALVAETPCRYYPNCLNAACPYKHGDGAQPTPVIG
ncbi:hypothetical protein SYNPS1DRAFT_26744 [Syncephalis pseudoplumigaleata]|uniref:C3H1-type domain-containing protein n=1 Tax=Syncephalis pseudoplumigaleata TaxID=1712513 RepID=A0A4P9Z519_9FUNG|nr:hypothetical protein SYNPS1DRAFT_26744 [Syncephalis pseudoplumigaleata]|eukprot:RKP27616.1 hypothetical protein SYNPS1DRAFT_26744 [Syncephalis pseudoplumigaleata]